jgi:hypothetical protein
MLMRLHLDEGMGEKEGYLMAVAEASIKQSIKCACKLIHFIDSNFDSKQLGPWWGNIQRTPLTLRN